MRMALIRRSPRAAFVQFALYVKKVSFQPHPTRWQPLTRPLLAREKPLTMYVFSNDKALVSSIVDSTSCGGMCVNDTLMHMGVETLPFGGVGYSGVGAYHGKATFDTFTHKKSCLIKNFSPIGEKLASGRYPPYTEGKLSFITALMRKRHGPSLAALPYLLCVALGAGLTYGIVAWNKAVSEEL